MDAFLKTAYYNISSSAAFGGVQKLRAAAIKAGFKKATVSKVKEWLERQETYSLFKRARKNFKRNTVPIVRIDYTWEADLGDLQKYSDENDGFKYFLLIIDTFSRYVWTVPMRSKSSKETTAAFETVFKEGRSPDILRTDSGGEFKSFALKKILDEENILHFFAQGETKANFSERAIQSIKMILTKDIYERQNKEWVSRLPAITLGYNNSVHRSTGMAPSEINHDNEDEVRLKQYLIRTKKNKKKKKLIKTTLENNVKGKKTRKKVILKATEKPFKFSPGDIVRVSYLKDLFTRAYDVNYSHELFRVVRAFRREGLPVYVIQDWDRDPVTGVFYEQELTLGAEPTDGTYKIEKVLKTRTVKGKKQAFVKFLGWHNKFNMWIDSASIKNPKKS